MVLKTDNIHYCFKVSIVIIDKSSRYKNSNIAQSSHFFRAGLEWIRDNGTKYILRAFNFGIKKTCCYCVCQGFHFSHICTEKANQNLQTISNFC